MKIRSLLALAGLAISFALPAFGQEKDTAVDPQIVQQLQAIGKKSDEAFLKGDAAGVAALYTEDAVLVNDTGPVYGRQAIEKYYAEQFQEVRYFRHDTKCDPISPHAIGTDGNVVRENGDWSGTFFLQGEDCGPHQVRGYFASLAAMVRSRRIAQRFLFYQSATRVRYFSGKRRRAGTENDEIEAAVLFHSCFCVVRVQEASVILAFLMSGIWKRNGFALPRQISTLHTL